MKKDRNECLRLTDAQKILQRDDIIEFDDGLFPGNPQSWKMVR